MRFGKRLRRTRRAVFSVAGIVGGTIIFGVALAAILVQITGSVSSNEFIPTTTTTSTTTTTVPSGDGLQAAISSSPDGCSAALAAASMDLGAISFDLNTGFATPRSHFLCVKNSGPGAITNLTIAAVTTASGEAGCSEAEGEVDPEGVTCGTDGELEDVLFFVLNQAGPFNGPGSGQCKTGAFVDPGSSQSLIDGSVSQGVECEWEVSLNLRPTANHDGKLAASTDTVGFTLEVTGSGSGS